MANVSRELTALSTCLDEGKPPFAAPPLTHTKRAHNDGATSLETSSRPRGGRRSKPSSILPGRPTINRPAPVEVQPAFPAAHKIHFQYSTSLNGCSQLVRAPACHVTDAEPGATRWSRASAVAELGIRVAV